MPPHHGRTGWPPRDQHAPRDGSRQTCGQSCCVTRRAIARVRLVQVGGSAACLHPFSSTASSETPSLRRGNPELDCSPSGRTFLLHVPLDLDVLLSLEATMEASALLVASRPPRRNHPRLTLCLGGDFCCWSADTAGGDGAIIVILTGSHAPQIAVYFLR
jgi:hypothetical protein